jgi:uncharacterized membrane protein YhaH (DUF805 family)
VHILVHTTFTVFQSSWGYREADIAPHALSSSGSSFPKSPGDIELSGYLGRKHPMIFSDLWQGRTARLPYLVVLVTSSAAIAVLPFIAGKITIAVAGGVDPAQAVTRMLLQPLLLAIGLLITGGPLVFFARRRMRELGLSGVWLLLFPIGPLQMLFLFGVASTSGGIWPTPITSPVTALPFWIEVAFGALLAVLPVGNYLEHSPNLVPRFAHLATTCDGRINRQTFVLRLAIAVGLTIILGALGAVGSVSGLARHGEHSLSVIASTARFMSELITVFVMMFMTATTIRRLHDLNRQGSWIILFPFGLPSLAAAPIFLANPLMITLLLNPLILFWIVQGVGCLILLVVLLLKRGSDLNNDHGLPGDRPNGSYVLA